MATYKKGALITIAAPSVLYSVRIVSTTTRRTRSVEARGDGARADNDRKFKDGRRYDAVSRIRFRPWFHRRNYN
jgi:hypothetical protein